MDPLTPETIMNGVHDMGGMHGFGKIQYLPEEPPFREEWEGRMFALLATVTGLGLMNIDEWRHGQERMNPAEYLSVSYYEHWLHSVVDLLERAFCRSPTSKRGWRR
jgi:hypothetical protein